MAVTELQLADIRPFADIGTEPTEHKGGVIHVTRNTVERRIFRKEETWVVIDADDRKSVFRSPATLLASPDFADLRRWANNQSLLSEKAGLEEGLLRMTGNLQQGSALLKKLDLARLDNWLTKQREEMAGDSSLVLVVDGQAGIGKTTFVRQLASRRAKTWGQKDLRPLVLHVESRGRVLQNLRDLFAFSLQSFRAPITFDQVPPLVRHGLVMVVIDGFDELADPNGYETAWSQLNELVDETRGVATLMLAGRETFISLNRVSKALPNFKPSMDAMPLLSINDISVDEAKEWLMKKHPWAKRPWTKKDFEKGMVKPMFEPGSYALRPVFLRHVSGLKAEIGNPESPAQDLLSILVDAMLDREATKFLETAPPPKMREFVRGVLEEVARDQAENQSSATPKQMLRWIVSMVGDASFSQEELRMLANRAESLAFLATDENSAWVRFSDEQIAAHFLARDCIRSVAAGEVPKYVRRNIFGREALDMLARAAVIADAGTVKQFLEKCSEQYARLGNVDRVQQNLIAFAVAVICGNCPEQMQELRFQDAYVNEMLIPADAPRFVLSNVTINTLYATGADLSEIDWQGSKIVTLFADRKTVFGAGFPPPQILEAPGEPALTDPKDILAWLGRNGSKDAQTASATINLPDDLLSLLQRIDRFRSFWIREEQDPRHPPTRKIVKDGNWDRVRDAMLAAELFQMRPVSAGGPPSKFYHLVHLDKPLLENKQLLEALRIDHGKPGA